MLHYMAGMIQLGLVAVFIYLDYSQKTFEPDPATDVYLYISPVALLLVIGSMFLHNRGLRKLQAIWGVEKKLKAFKNNLIRTVLIFVVAAAVVDVIFLVTVQYWLLALSGAILIPYVSLYITQMRVIKAMKLTPGEVNELKGYYEKKASPFE